MSGIYVPGKGSGSARLAVVAEAPSYEEEAALEPLVGPSGREFDRLLNSCGINRLDLWVTNVVKFMIPFASEKGHKIPFSKRCEMAGVNLQTQIDELRRELQAINPNCILALGGSALWALTGKSNINDYRGSILVSWLGKKLIGTYHPASFFHSEESGAKEYWKREITKYDIKRAWAESQTEEINLPRRSLHIANNSHEVATFIEQNKHESKLSIDIEAHNCIPFCIGISFNRDSALTVPLWKSISIDDLAWSWIHLSRLFVSPHFKKIGQNFKYDQDKITRLGLPIDRLHSDTMLKAFTLNPELPKNLAFNTSIYTREPFYKNEGMYEGSEKDLMIGCARDASVTLEIDDIMEHDINELGLADFYYNFVMQLHPLYLDIENEGLYIDKEKRDELLKKYIKWDEQLRFDMFKLTGEYPNVNSPKQVAELLYNKLHVPFRPGTGEEVLTGLLNGNSVKNADHKQVIDYILEARRVRKVISNNLAALPDYDGKMRTTYFLCLETGRSSTGQQDPPIRPTEEIIEIGEDGKRKKKKKALGTPFQTMTKHGDIGPEVRAMYIPDEGHVFLQADSSQAEARVIFLLAEDYEALQLIDTHDYHAITTSWFFGGTEETYSKKILGYECPERFIGKTLRHAGHLGATKRAASIAVNTDARKFKIKDKHGNILKISEPYAAKALETFHARQPKIKQIFQASVIKCLERNRKLVAPVPVGIDARKGGERTFFGRWNEELFRVAFSYIPQRVVSENTKAAALFIHREYKWIRIIIEAHDALLVMVPIEREMEAAMILREAFERPISFANCSLPRGELKIPCEVERGENYFEMKKFRFEHANNPF